jgi:LPXTG-site transpeptidase (sortase) family protein
MFFRLLLAATLAFSQIPLASALSFSDVTTTRYQDAYAYLSEKGYIRGYSDGRGRPYQAINRAEALKVLLESQSLLAQRVRFYSTRRPPMPLFTDIDQSAWYAPYLETAFEYGLVRGYPDRTFRPSKTINAEEAVTLIMRAYGSHQQGAGNDGWYALDMQSATQKNLMSTAETIYIGRPLTRGQFLDMVYRMEVIRRDSLVAFPDPGHQTIARAPAVPTYAPSTNTYRPATAPSVARPTATTAQVPSANFTISVPKLGISNLVVTRPSDPFTSKGLLAPLVYGVGQLFGNPGGGSKILVYGHSSSYAWDVSKFTKIFTRVNELVAGDRVTVTYNGKVYTYEVTHQQRIAPNDISPFKGAGEELILYTCWPVGTAKERLIVHAKPVDSVAQR